MVSSDQTQSILSVVFHQSHGNANFYYVRLRGLDEAAVYQVNGEQKKYTGEALMNAGFILPNPWGDYQAYQYVFSKYKE